jgi:chromosome segregation ATPase
MKKNTIISFIVIIILIVVFLLNCADNSVTKNKLEQNITTAIAENNKLRRNYSELSALFDIYQDSITYLSNQISKTPFHDKEELKSIQSHLEKIIGNRARDIEYIKDGGALKDLLEKYSNDIVKKDKIIKEKDKIITEKNKIIAKQDIAIKDLTRRLGIETNLRKKAEDDLETAKKYITRLEEKLKEKAQEIEKLQLAKAALEHVLNTDNTKSEKEKEALRKKIKDRDDEIIAYKEDIEIVENEKERLADKHKEQSDAFSKHKITDFLVLYRKNNYRGTFFNLAKASDDVDDEYGTTKTKTNRIKVLFNVNKFAFKEDDRESVKLRLTITGETEKCKGGNNLEDIFVQEIVVSFASQNSFSYSYIYDPKNKKIPIGCSYIAKIYHGEEIIFDQKYDVKSKRKL